MSKLRVLDLFSGIGGFSLGLERTGGFETVAFCEIDPFCQRVLRKHWPNERIYSDVKELTADVILRDGLAIDVICGGFPCQDISEAGERDGLDGERSALWGEYARIVGELRPAFFIVENVANLLAGSNGDWFGKVLGDVASLGYDAEWHCIQAADIGAKHIRDRVWVVGFLANPSLERGMQCWGEQLAKDSNPQRTIREWTDQPEPLRVVDDVPFRTHRCRALGNAVVPVIPEIIGRAILQARAS